MIRVKQRGSFRNTERFFKNAQNADPRPVMEKYGAMGVRALAEATPKDTARTSERWFYEIKMIGGDYLLAWDNDNAAGSTLVAFLLYYGHATANGGYVSGVDFIRPALEPVLGAMAEELVMKMTD